MTALLDIYNVALLRAGAPPLVSVFDESKARRDCDQFYKVRRPSLLRRYRWRFAIRRARLTPVAGAPAFGYPKAMRLPADCNTVIGASPYEDSGRELLTGAMTTYRLEGQDLITDCDEMFIVYVADVDNPEQFDPLFTEALTFFMAGDLSLSIGNDRQMAFACYEEAREALRRARMAGAIEQPPEVPDTYGLFDSRGRSGRLAERGPSTRVLGPAYYTPEGEPR
jgi:hypothetical protein